MKKPRPFHLLGPYGTTLYFRGAVTEITRDRYSLDLVVTLRTFQHTISA